MSAPRKETLAEGVELWLGLVPVVQDPVLGAGHHGQVLDAVVRLVAVDVVDNFVTPQRSAEMALHNDAMFATPGCIPPNLGGEGDVAVGVVGLAPAIVRVIRTHLGSGLTLKTPATFGNSLPEGPLRNGLLGATLASAQPVVQSPPPLGVGHGSQSPKTLPRQVRDFVGAPVLCVGG